MNDSVQDLEGGLTTQEFIDQGLNIIFNSPQYQSVYDDILRNNGYPLLGDLYNFIDPNFINLSPREKLDAVKRTLIKYQLPMPGERRLAAPGTLEGLSDVANNPFNTPFEVMPRRLLKARCKIGSRRGPDGRCHKKRKSSKRKSSKRKSSKRTSSKRKSSKRTSNKRKSSSKRK